MRAILASNKNLLGNNIVLATRFLDRLKGLLGKDSLSPGQGLLIRPCKGIHTFFMKFPIDVVFLDKENLVIAFIENLPPNRLTTIYRTAHSVLELPAGSLDSKISINDRIELS